MNQDILNQLIKIEEVYDELIIKFPNLYSSFVSLKQKTSNETINNAYKTIHKFYIKNKKFKFFINKNTRKYKITKNSIKNDVRGLILVIDKKEDTYKSLMEKIKYEKWEFKGISIVEEFNNLRLYFY
jgi:hypothetical protein